MKTKHLKIRGYRIMKITFLGAAEAVTGSCYLVETDQTSFLIDCGMHQGRPDEDQMNRAPFPFDMDQIDFMLLTHAHIDHSGRIPKLYVAGYRNPIYATKATVELCGIMLPDSGHIQEMEQEWQTRKSKRAGRPVEAALYTMQDAIDSCRLFQKVRYDAEFTPSPDVRVRMRDAGHILGSAILEIWVREGNSTGNRQETKIVFSGDLGNKGIPIMRDPTIIDGTDYLVIESTYGDRLHKDNVDKVDRFVRIINETIALGGNVVIPSFAVGRTQEIIYELNREKEKYKNQRTAFMQTPVYVDSPLAVSATRIFRENTDCYDDEARRYIEDGDHPLDFPNLHFTASAEESKALNMSEESKIIISASGMCDAGRIKHHLKHNLWRQDSTVLFVGFQAQGTLGRRLVDGAKTVRIFDEEIAVRARIESIEGFSGHADRDGLLDWIAAMQLKPSRIILVHGEPEVIASFQKTIDQKFGIATHIAELDETLIIGADVIRRGVAADRLPEVAIDQRIMAVTQSLDALQKEFALLTERSKAAIRQAHTLEDRDAILEQLKTQYQKAADDLLAKIH
jgi:metallo-beta-lactamase family protein